MRVGRIDIPQKPAPGFLEKLALVKNKWRTANCRRIPRPIAGVNLRGQERKSRKTFTFFSFLLQLRDTHLDDREPFCGIQKGRNS
jgi:hypothetical protein